MFGEPLLDQFAGTVRMVGFLSPCPFFLLAISRISDVTKGVADLLSGLLVRHHGPVGGRALEEAASLGLDLFHQFQRQVHLIVLSLAVCVLVDSCFDQFP